MSKFNYNDTFMSISCDESKAGLLNINPKTTVNNFRPQYRPSQQFEEYQNMRQIKASPSLRSNSLGTSLCKLKKKYEGSKENYRGLDLLV